MQFGVYKDAAALGIAFERVSALSWDGERMVSLIEAERGSGTMMMYDYDLNRILAMLHHAGITSVALDHSNHGGAHGAFLYGRRR